MHNFTTEDLVQYLYNELSLQKTIALKAALENDWSLREEFEALVSDQKRLEAVKLSPRKESVSRILNYAEKAMGELHSH